MDCEDKEGRMKIREASVLRYKEKRHNRLFAKRIRYEVRKLNAEKRPRIKVTLSMIYKIPPLSRVTHTTLFLVRICLNERTILHSAGSICPEKRRGLGWGGEHTARNRMNKTVKSVEVV